MLFLPHCPLMRLHSRTLASCLLLAFIVIPAVTAAPIDEFRISDIEQKIRDLETTTREQTRLIAQLQSQVGSQPSTTKPGATTAIMPNRSEQRWLTADNWAQVAIGMNELQIIELLGVPTQLRSSDDGQTRTLLYAMEIGRSGFLGGKVELQNGKATHIEAPHLR